MILMQKIGKKYQVTSDGRIWSELTGKYLALCDNGAGYLKVNLSRKGKKVNKYVHRLVAQQYIPNPYDLPEVNHIDGDKTNNRIENLEWCSRLQNMKHAYFNGLIKTHKVRHGSVNEYINFKCRCAQCRNAWNIYHKTLMVKKRIMVA